MTRIENEWRYFDEALQMPYPWLTKPCLEVLDKMDLRGKRVFEFGCGDSTLWLRKRGAEVIGVESEYMWACYAGVHFRAYDHEYTDEITKHGMFDIVVIDGQWRDACTYNALKHLKSGGLLIIDNWMQESVEPNDWTKTLQLTRHLEMKVYPEPEHTDWKTATWIQI